MRPLVQEASALLLGATHSNLFHGWGKSFCFIY